VVAMTFPFVGTHTRADWASWQVNNADLTDEGPVLAAASLPVYVSPTPVLETFPPELVVEDLDVDSCGDLYLLSEAGDVYRYDRPHEELRRLPCTFEDTIESPTGLRVTADTIYVGDAGSSDGDDGQVLAVSKHVLQTRWIAATAFASPVALVGEGEDVVVLDAGPPDADASGFLATIDRSARIRREVIGIAPPVDAAVDRRGNRYVLAPIADADGASAHTNRALTQYSPPASVGKGYDRRTETDGTDSDEPTDRNDDGTTADNNDDRRPEPSPVDADEGKLLVAPDEFRTRETGPFMPGHIEADHVDEVIVGMTTGDDADDDDGFLFRYRPMDAEFERLTSYRGLAMSLQLSRDRETCEPAALYAVAGDRNAVIALEARVPHRLNDTTDRYDAQLVAKLDAGIDRVQWHRVTTELTTDARTEVRVRYLATDDSDQQYDPRPGIDPEEAIEGIGPTVASRLRTAGINDLWALVATDPADVAGYASTATYTVTQRQATDWIREARRILNDWFDGESEWRTLDADPRDALLDDAVGRYLWVRVDLIGTRFETPTVESFRAYFPRQSYLRYLPSIYREDEASAAFLERFLSIFESTFVDIEEDIEAAIRYLDPDGVPAESLPWLGSWLALSADETWPAAAHRELVRRAPDLFRYRGTEAGLLAMTRIFLGDRFKPSVTAEWYLARQREAIEARRDADDLTDEAATRAIERLDPTPWIWEPPDLFCADDKTVESIYERLLPCSQCFALVVPPFVDETAMETVERIVRSQAPAHTAGRAIRLQPRIELAGNEHEGATHTYLGVNSVLADRDLVIGESTLGTDSELIEREPDGQLGLQSRLDADTRIS
jgi:phage tail-like protein